MYGHLGIKWKNISTFAKNMRIIMLTALCLLATLGATAQNQDSTAFTPMVKVGKVM